MEHMITSSPWGFRFYPFEKYCRVMRDFGIRNICVMFGNPETFPLALSSGRQAAEEYRDIAAEHGLSVVEMATSMNYEPEMPLASFLGARYFRVCDLWKDTPEEFRRVANMLKEMGTMAEDHGLIVTVENHGGLMGSARQCRRLFEEVHRKNVLLNYDPANFLYFGEDPLRAFDLLAPWIAFTHIKNVKYADGAPVYCRIREGVIDYARILEKLTPVYDGYFCLEYEKDIDVEEGTRDDLRSLRSLLETRPVFVCRSSPDVNSSS